MKFLLTSIEAEDMFLCSLIRTTRLLVAEWPIGIFCWRDGLPVLTAGQLRKVDLATRDSDKPQTSRHSIGDGASRHPSLTDSRKHNSLFHENTAKAPCAGRLRSVRSPGIRAKVLDAALPAEVSRGVPRTVRKHGTQR